MKSEGLENSRGRYSSALSITKGAAFLSIFVLKARETVAILTPFQIITSRIEREITEHASSVSIFTYCVNLSQDDIDPGFTNLLLKFHCH